MRVSYVLLVAAATLFASCHVASAAIESGRADLSQVASKISIQSAGVVGNGNPTTRRLRTGDDGEDRAFEALKSLLPLNKIVGKDGKTFSGNFVKSLLKSESTRETTFQYWAKAEIDGNALREMLGNMNKNGRVELLNRYTAYIGPRNGVVHHRPGPIG
ncbi:hypothetical protein PHYPSEUDO_012092 [Phytophthora pseudosyringae]|uniref:RxLR effector protein n=1 Tax=Phytophthora pseudosyringae TaxID=221518 RepID=A0A8T1W5L8_9STRA|nr:hypothetical protein PHYPSEUDO_012092 [Phytophthora pseudosyringae]